MATISSVSSLEGSHSRIQPTQDGNGFIRRAGNAHDRSFMNGFSKSLVATFLSAELKVRERILVWLDMSSGLRRGELAGLRWQDIQFQELAILAQRSAVDQMVGDIKTEGSKRPIPIDPYIAEDLLFWYRTTKYSGPDDYVFATDAPRAGKKRGKQPVLLSKVMSYHIQPAAKRPLITSVSAGTHSGAHTRLCYMLMAKM